MMSAVTVGAVMMLPVLRPSPSPLLSPGARERGSRFPAEGRGDFVGDPFEGTDELGGCRVAGVGLNDQLGGVREDAVSLEAGDDLFRGAVMNVGASEVRLLAEPAREVAALDHGVDVVRNTP